MCIFCLNSGSHQPTGLFDTARFDGISQTHGDIVEEEGDAPYSFGTTVSMEPEDTFEGSVTFAGDRDNIRVWLEDGATYEINLTGRSNGTLDPVEDTVLTLYDLNGDFINSDDDGGDGLYSRLVHTASYTGWHILQAESFDTEGGDYEIAVTQRSWNAEDEDLGDAPGNENTDYFLATGDIFRGAYDYRGDIDWVEIYLEANRVYAFTVDDYDGPEDTLPIARDPQLWLLDSDGNELAYDDDDYFDQNAQFIYTVEDSGTYYLSTSFAGAAGTGHYDIEYFETGFNLTDPADTETTDATAGRQTRYLYTEDQIFRGAIDYIGDEDWIELQLEAGKTYTLHADTDWYFWAHLDDPLMTLYDADGNVIATDDDDGPGTDAALRFTPTETGSYYVGIESAVSDGTAIGYYAFYARDETTVTDPMDAINWGTGTLPVDGPVQVYFAASQWFVNEDGEGLRLDDYTAEEIDFFMAALDTISVFTPLTFERTFDPFGADLLVGLSELKGSSGFANPPGSGLLPEGAIVMDNWEGYWTANMMQTGSFTHGTVLHEAGHALGLAHPHDGGGESEIMRGVLSSSDTGDGAGYYLNQFPYTIMSYNELWDGLTVEPEFEDGIGGLGTFGALDIAALQALYGTSTNKGGNTTYRLSDNDWFEAIWDTGGMDTIRAGGFDDAVIDLTAATLDYSETGGGVVSYQQGAFGGFTIAAGVEIERGFGARGDDHITGNALDNHLRGSNGKDTLIGLEGADTLEGGRGLDVISGGDGEDIIRGGAGGDTITGNRSADLLLGNSGNDMISGGNGADTIDGGRGHDVIEGGTGSDWLTGGSGEDVFVFADGDGSDTIDAFQKIDLIDLTAYGVGLSFGDLTITSPTADAATLTIAGSSTQITFTDLKTVLGEEHFVFDEVIA